jgi:predicted kinase
VDNLPRKVWPYVSPTNIKIKDGDWIVQQFPDKFDLTNPTTNFNPNHDEKGRFADANESAVKQAVQDAVAKTKTSYDQSERKDRLARGIMKRWPSEKDFADPPLKEPDFKIPPPDNDSDMPAWLDKVEASPQYKEVVSRISDYNKDALGQMGDFNKSKPELFTWSRDQYTQPDGKLTPERAELHRQIVASMLNPNAVAKPGTKPIAVFLMGPPGAGKTTSGKPYAKKFGVDFTEIAPDEIKVQLPEYRGWNSGIVHEESCDIAEKKLYPRAMAMKHNLLFDMTGNTASKMKKYAEQLGTLGYDTHAILVTTPRRVAAARVWSRFQHSHRFIPPRFSFEKTGLTSDEQAYFPTATSKNEITYQVLKKSPEVKSWVEIETNDQGPPKVLDEGKRHKSSMRYGEQTYNKRV